jgi:hypothetical protein
MPPDERALRPPHSLSRTTSARSFSLSAPHDVPHARREPPRSPTTSASTWPSTRRVPTSSSLAIRVSAPPSVAEALQGASVDWHARRAAVTPPSILQRWQRARSRPTLLPRSNLLAAHPHVPTAAPGRQGERGSHACGSSASRSMKPQLHSFNRCDLAFDHRVHRPTLLCQPPPFTAEKSNHNGASPSRFPRRPARARLREERPRLPTLSASAPGRRTRAAPKDRFPPSRSRSQAEPQHPNLPAFPDHDLAIHPRPPSLATREAPS